jgi:MOSC domain-containing protein YiiM
MGSVQSIVVRPLKRGEPKRITEANILPGGIEGDHYAKPDGHRQVTLIAADDLATVAADTGFKGDAHMASRRNICVDHFPPGDLIGERVALGEEVILEITCYCAPCSRMDENLGEGAVHAFSKKAGWGAKVIQEGHIRVGDEFNVL